MPSTEPTSSRRPSPDWWRCPRHCGRGRCSRHCYHRGVGTAPTRRAVQESRLVHKIEENVPSMMAYGAGVLRLMGKRRNIRCGPLEMESGGAAPPAAEGRGRVQQSCFAFVGVSSLTILKEFTWAGWTVAHSLVPLSSSRVASVVHRRRRGSCAYRDKPLSQRRKRPLWVHGRVGG